MSVTVTLMYSVHIFIPWAQPSGGSRFQVTLHQEASTGPGPAVVQREAVSQELPEIPLAGPTHWRATERKDTFVISVSTWNEEGSSRL